jgi:predicted nucleic acid-binding protein
MTAEAAELAGELWRQRSKKSKDGRKRVVADFLIGAHAQAQADTFLTRDREFYRQYFKNMKVVGPE